MEMLVIVKKVLVMAVNHGNAGQMFLPYVSKKVKKLLEMKEEYKFQIYWDGSCGMDKINTYAPQGVDIYSGYHHPVWQGKGLWRYFGRAAKVIADKRRKD